MLIPVVAWYFVMTNVREEEYPKWLQSFFNQKHFGKTIESVLIFLSACIVIYMIVCFRLPSSF